jgi:hypothetical protein
VLDLLFPVNSVVDIPITFKPNQPMAVIISRKPGTIRCAMLVRTPFNAIGNPNIEDVRPASDDVDEVAMFSLAHHSQLFSGLRAK